MLILASSCVRFPMIIITKFWVEDCFKLWSLISDLVIEPVPVCRQDYLLLLVTTLHKFPLMGKVLLVLYVAAFGIEYSAREHYSR
jgi:hypothetical protein